MLDSDGVYRNSFGVPYDITNLDWHDSLTPDGGIHKCVGIGYDYKVQFFDYNCDVEEADKLYGVLCVG